MKNLKKYGKAPFNVAVIHGGPGAAGEMAPVARKLASDFGVLEPHQTETSINGQAQELFTDLKTFGDFPITLIGFSWGAWLSFIVSAKYSSIIKKLILISSGGFEETYAERFQETFLNRLNEADKKKFHSLIKVVENPAAEDRNSAFERFGALFSKADAYDSIGCDAEKIDCQVDIFQSVWKEAMKLRKSGRLLEFGKHIQCPVVAIHGDHDCHPPEGVQKPLSAILKRFRFILLKKCGHKPWIERAAREEFYRRLKEELLYIE